MKASSLRIGNYVFTYLSDNADGIEQVTINTLRVMTENPTKKTIYEPIPLTEEWLLKMGFEKDDNYYTSYRLDEGYITVKAEDNDWDDLCLDVFIKTADMDKEFYLTAIEHVHSLQNLYFALTGEELTIKDK
jgi:hypothetical protein